MPEARTITVELDPTAHNRQPVGEKETLTWEVLDTTWALLREYATRLVLLDIREEAARRGMEFPADEELFAQDSDDPEFPRDYLALAAASEIAGRGLQATLEILYRDTHQMAKAGLAIEGIDL